jgi:uncharacterized protein (TIGR03067 family)
VETKDDRKALQGTWVLTSVEWLGEITVQDTEAGFKSPSPSGEHCDLLHTSGRITLTFDGDRYTFRQGERETAMGRFKLDVQSSPRVIERRTDANRYAVTIAGYGLFSADDRFFSSYSLEWDTLRWCQRELFPSDRNSIPRTFATKDEDVYLLTFKRES